MIINLNDLKETVIENVLPLLETQKNFINLEFSCMPKRGEEEYYGYKGKVVGDNIIIREYNYYISGEWGMFEKSGQGGAPFTYDDTLIIKGVDDMNVTIKNSTHGSITGYKTDKNEKAIKCQIIDELYNNCDELISDIKSGLSVEMIQEKYNIDSIENGNAKKM